MKIEIKPFNELLSNGELSKMFYEAFGLPYKASFSSALTEPQPEEVGLLFDKGVKVSFFSFKREKDFILLIDFGCLKAAAENYRFMYFIKIIEELHALGFENVGVEIMAAGRLVLIDYLRVGFEIIGCRRTERKLLVQLKHSKINAIPGRTKCSGINSPISGTIH
ncbi:MAG: hypothetical protein ABFD50_08400 [Smithella sp.]